MPRTETGWSAYRTWYHPVEQIRDSVHSIAFDEEQTNWLLGDEDIDFPDPHTESLDGLAPLMIENNLHGKCILMIQFYIESVTINDHEEQNEELSSAYLLKLDDYGNEVASVRVPETIAMPIAKAFKREIQDTPYEIDREWNHSDEIQEDSIPDIVASLITEDP